MQIKSSIKKINKLLIDFFGVPEKNKKIPSSLDMLIATILSQNTNDNNSYKAFNNLKTKFKNWDEVEKLTASQIESYIKVAGLGKQKSAAIKNVLTTLRKKNKKISLDYLKKNNDEEILEELTNFPGVGIKTASCVLQFSLRRNVCPVDTHVHRTLNRIGLVKTSTPDKTFLAIKDNLPENTAHSFHTNLIRLGREICKSQNPVCSICPLKKICTYEHKNFKKKDSYKSNSFMLLDSI